MRDGCLRFLAGRCLVRLVQDEEISVGRREMMHERVKDQGRSGIKVMEKGCAWKGVGCSE